MGCTILARNRYGTDEICVIFSWEMWFVFLGSLQYPVLDYLVPVVGISRIEVLVLFDYLVLYHTLNLTLQ